MSKRHKWLFGYRTFYQSCNVISYYGPSFSRLLLHDDTLVTCSPPLQLSFYSSAHYNISTYSTQFTKYNCILSLISQRYLNLTHTFRLRHTDEWSETACHIKINLPTRIDSFHFSWITFAKFRSIWTTQSSAVSDPCGRKKVHPSEHSTKSCPSTEGTVA